MKKAVVVIVILILFSVLVGAVSLDESTRSSLINKGYNIIESRNLIRIEQEGFKIGNTDKEFYFSCVSKDKFDVTELGNILPDMVKGVYLRDMISYGGALSIGFITPSTVPNKNSLINPVSSLDECTYVGENPKGNLITADSITSMIDDSVEGTNRDNAALSSRPAAQGGCTISICEGLKSAFSSVSSILGINNTT